MDVFSNRARHPYDCSVLIKEDLVEIVNAQRATNNTFTDDKYLIDVQRANSSTRETSLVCSLTENLDDIDMWVRYVNNGKGFCIEYDFDELALLSRALFPFVYGDIVKSIKEFSNKRKVYIDTLLKKTDKLNWKSQNEWGIISNINEIEQQTNKILGKLIDAPKPKAIYLGYNIDHSQDLKDKLLRYCKSNRIACLQTILSSNDVGINTEAISY